MAMGNKTIESGKCGWSSTKKMRMDKQSADVCLNRMLLPLKYNQIHRQLELPQMNPNISSAKKVSGDNIEIEGTEEKINSAHNPFLSRYYEKTTPIGFQFHQVEVPDVLPEPSTFPLSLQLQQNPTTYQNLSTTFLASRVQDKQLEDYLAFAENYFEEKIPDYFSQDMPQYVQVCSNLNKTI